MAKSVNRIVCGLGLVVLLVFPARAQIGPMPTPLQPNPAGNTSSAPVARDQYGNPLPDKQPTEAERAGERREDALRAANQLAEEERKAAEARRAADESRNTEQLAEEQRFHNQLIRALYTGFAVVVVLVGALFVKRSKAR